MRICAPILCGIFFVLVCAVDMHSMHEKKIYRQKHWQDSQGWLYKSNKFVGDVLSDAVWLNANLFSVTSAKILTALLPFYLPARMADEHVQNNFYDASCHKNVNQLPNWCYLTAQVGVGIPMVVLSSLAFFANDYDLAQTGRMLMIGLPFVHWGKELIKTMDTKACLRPWNERFSCTKRSLGGFPSGHMANATYMTALFTMRHGLKFGIPLGIFSTFLFVEFLSCNRHYFSQLIAGAGLGLLYAFAANKVVEKKVSDHVACSFAVNSFGGPQVTLEYHF